LHRDQRAKAVTGNPGRARFRVDRLDPVESRRRIRQFADAIVKAALRTADAAKVKAQRGKTARKGLVHSLRHAVIHRAAGLRVRVEDHRHGRARAGAGLESGLRGGPRGRERSLRASNKSLIKWTDPAAITHRAKPAAGTVMEAMRYIESRSAKAMISRSRVKER
jgi:hypothetical protein